MSTNKKENILRLILIIAGIISFLIFYNADLGPGIMIKIIVFAIIVEVILAVVDLVIFFTTKWWGITAEVISFDLGIFIG